MRIKFALKMTLAWMWALPVGAVGVCCMILPPVGLIVLAIAAWPVKRTLSTEIHRQVAEEMSHTEEEEKLPKPWDVTIEEDIDYIDIEPNTGGRGSR